MGPAMTVYGKVRFCIIDSFVSVKCTESEARMYAILSKTSQGLLKFLYNWSKHKEQELGRQRRTRQSSTLGVMEDFQNRFPRLILYLWLFCMCFAKQHDLMHALKFQSATDADSFREAMKKPPCAMNDFQSAWEEAVRFSFGQGQPKSSTQPPPPQHTLNPQPTHQAPAKCKQQ